MNYLSLKEIIHSFPNEEECIEHLEKLLWNGVVISPFSHNSKVYYCKNGKYKCRDTGRYFNVKTNTIFHNSKISLQKWFAVIWIISSGNIPSSVKLGQDLNISQKTAWYMIHRIKKYFDIKSETNIKFVGIKNEEIENIEVIVDQDKLKLTEWLNLLKK
jgi:transposase-like protein